MDFRTKTNEYCFGVRVSALMVEDDKIYLAKSPNDEYYLLGGAIFVNELTKDAIRREIKEEVGADSEVGSLAFIVENQFYLEDTNYHQIEFHYLVNLLSEPNEKMIEGGQTHQCEWVSIDNLDQINLNPAFLKTALKNWDGQIKHVVNKDGEE